MSLDLLRSIRELSFSSLTPDGTDPETAALANPKAVFQSRRLAREGQVTAKPDIGSMLTSFNNLSISQPIGGFRQGANYIAPYNPVVQPTNAPRTFIQPATLAPQGNPIVAPLIRPSIAPIQSNVGTVVAPVQGGVIAPIQGAAQPFVFAPVQPPIQPPAQQPQRTGIYTREGLEAMKVPELKIEVKSLGGTQYSKLKKAELINLILALSGSA